MMDKVWILTEGSLIVGGRQVKCVMPNTKRMESNLAHGTMDL